ncbi:hypothetical protein [Saccharopolyspora spinosa]|uniref:Mce-associated membrane protein n=1 Tax=Saccharopolyspora spinosa TaxID=60894 RepID=A0A2N3XQG7_SACSN|nr:hypothetical protein [Saccharopolyspora spinosa]PKW12928.1 Mce-associated membrane protein [Saccharopolyspora spinosa]
MPSNRRNDRQPPTRRPKVAGLRNRATLHGENLQEEAREARRTESDQRAPVAERGKAHAERSFAAELNGADVAEPVCAGKTVAERGETSVAETDPAARPSGEGVLSAPAEPEQETAEPDGAQADAEAVRPAAAAALAQAAEGLSTGGAKRGGTVPKSVVAVFGAAAVFTGLAVAVFAGLAVWFGIEAYSARFSGAAANEALVSAGATSEVNGQISDAVEKVFSYDFNDTAKTETAARDLLVGSAVQRYDELFKVVREQAPQQQLIVTTTVQTSAVTRLQGDRAELLLFVDQRAMRANTGESNVGPAQISVSAQKQGDRWKITQITLR